jgi:hypothetical protein
MAYHKLPYILARHMNVQALHTCVCICCFYHCRIVQKGTGQEGASLWLLATDSLAPDDTAACRPINIAAARQLLGGFSSLGSISELSARGALLVSSAVPLRVRMLHLALSLCQVLFRSL